MADSMSITGGTTNIDISKWKKLTPQEIIKEKSKGQEIPAEIITWAEQMQRFDQMPDDVTYEEVDGDVGIEALNKLGLANTQQINNIENAEGNNNQDSSASNLQKDLDNLNLLSLIEKHLISPNFAVRCFLFYLLQFLFLLYSFYF